MANLTDEEIAAADQAGREEFVREPHASVVNFDQATGLVTLDLYNGCRFAFPARVLQGLENASDEELAEVELSPFGYGLHWERLDADFTVPGLLAGQFGTARFMEAHRGRLGEVYDRLLKTPPSSDWNAQAAE